MASRAPRRSAAAPRPGAMDRAPVDRRRVVIENVRPSVDCGTLAAKAAVGQPLEVSADVFADGHDLLAVVVRHGAPGGESSPAAWEEVPMLSLGNDRWAAKVVPTANGPWAFELLGLVDDWATWLRDLRLRHEAGQELDVELEVGARICESRARQPHRRRGEGGALAALARTLRNPDLTGEERLTAAAHADAQALLRGCAPWATQATAAGPFPLFVDRERAVFSAWYELFPRSEGAQPPATSGSFATAARRLPAIAAMGFDTVYLPPIHPIGRAFRKGRNNSLDAAAGDPGSPWAIGSAEGGHTAVNPELGSLRDFDGFVAAAQRCGLEVALDFAIQCSPDHPWVTEHPEWFKHRPDGSIRYAENPPKRYQDIYPIDFDTDDRAALEAALIDVVRFWVGRGVRVFRVDNPHTKPLRFWQRLIGAIQRERPDVQFLSEAFTRPRLMERLAKLGFTQSYTYFTWRNTVAELADYLRELAQTERVDFFRPNFWVNTPDILHETLQRGGPPAFRLRAVLAAICAPSWGMYSGYELCENTPVREDSEEYLDSEKYQLRPRDWASPRSIVPLVTRLNEVRRAHRAAIAQLRTLRVHHVDGDQLLAVSRMDDARSDILLAVVNLDPLEPHEGVVWLDLDALGLPAEAAYEVRDELSGAAYVWRGPSNYVRLDPAVQPAHVFHVLPR